MLRKMSSALVALGLGGAFTVLKFAGPKSSEIPVVPLAAKTTHEIASAPIVPAPRIAPFLLPVPQEDLSSKLTDLDPECRKIAVSAVKLNVQDLGFALRYQSRPQVQEMPRHVVESFEKILASGKCGTNLKEPKLKQAYEYLRKQCALPAPTSENFDQRFNQMQGCLLGLRIWRSEVADMAYKNVPLKDIKDPGVVAALIEGQFTGLGTQTEDPVRAAALARRFSELMPTSPQAAILRFQTALMHGSISPPAEHQDEMDAAVDHLKRVAPDTTRLAEIELDRVASRQKPEELEEAATLTKQEHPDSFLGPYYTAYSLALKGDKAGAKQELVAYLDRHPTSTLLAHTLSLMNGMPDAKPENLFLNRSKVLFLEQFDADETTGELPTGSWSE